MKTNENTRTVAVLGASPKPERYSNKAIRSLVARGHPVVPVHPAIPEIEGLKVEPSLESITESIDTLTMYVSPAISSPLRAAILSLNPRRVIFNPGTENPDLAAALREGGVATEEACTLVLLNTDQF